MKTRQLGKTGLEVGERGVGAWELGREIDAGQALRQLCAALDAGRNFVDTAPTYAAGESEKIVGEAIRELRARDFAVVATRVVQPDAPPQAVVHSVEGSLRAMRAEVLPLVHVTVSAGRRLDDARWRELGAAMEELIRAGKILFWGLAPDGGQAREEKAEKTAKTAEESRLELLGDPGVSSVRLTVEELGLAGGHSIGVVAIGDAAAALADERVSVAIETAW